MSKDIGVDANIDRIRIKEVESPSTPPTGYGYIYAKTDGLYFKGDGGTEIGPLAASSDAQTVYGTIFAHPASDFNTATGNFRANGPTTGTDVLFTFYIPEDFNGLQSAKILAIGNGTDASTFDVDSQYGHDGEAYNTHGTSITTGSYNVVLNSFIEIDISGALASLGAGDILSIAIDKNGSVGVRFIGGFITYLKA